MTNRIANHIEKLFETNWDEIKGNIKTQWGKLTNQDIRQIEGSYDILVGKLKKIYGYTKEEIEDELENFLDSEGIKDMKEKVLNVKDEITERAHSFKDTVEEYMHSYLQCIKDKTADLEASIIQYAKENPMKILGTAAILSYALTKALSVRK